MRQVFAAATRDQALAAARQLADDWRGSHPQVAQVLEDEIKPCLACLAFPLAHQPRIRTTNGLERLNQELKRCTAVVRIFPNRDACLRFGIDPVSRLSRTRDTAGEVIAYQAAAS